MRWPPVFSADYLLVALAFAAVVAAAEKEPAAGAALPDKVLFVGISFTYYNNSLHRHYRQLTYSAGLFTPENSRARIMTISGGELPEHAGGFERVLSGDDWDVVVLQGHSLGPISERTAEPFREAARKFAGIAREQGTRPVFFMTWAYSGNPEMTAKLDKAYTDIGRELDAQVVPVGLAFARVTSERPDIALRIADARHPSLAGTYLAACTFFAALYGQSPEGLEYDAGLGKEMAAYLQQVAWRTVQDYAHRESIWSFTNWNGPSIPVRTYVPLGRATSTPVVIVMHGASRDAPRYFADWKKQAEQHGFILVVPYLSEQDFPGSKVYNLGHVFDADTGAMRPESQWLFSIIEPLFDEVIERTGSDESKYTLYGHSAGSQFVHRFMYYMPEARADRFIAANAGWYTLTDFDVPYPYGLQDSSIEESALERIFAAPMTLLLGTADIDVNADKLRKTPQAESQGANRLERGHNLYRVAKAEADRLGLAFNWRLLEVEGADHSNARMAPDAALLIP